MASILITFGEANLEGTSQPHDDALVVTSQIRGFLVKRVMVDQGSSYNVPRSLQWTGAEIRGFSSYDTLLVGFDKKIITLEGQIKLSIATEGKEVEVNFIVVNAFSPYIAILRRP